MDVFEMLEKQNCNVLVCGLRFQGSGTFERQVKTCREINQLVYAHAGEEASFYLEWQYPLSRVVTARCSLEQVEAGETHIILRDVRVQFRQLKVSYGYTRVDELNLPAAELRRPLAQVHLASAPA